MTMSVAGRGKKSHAFQRDQICDELHRVIPWCLTKIAQQTCHYLAAMIGCFGVDKARKADPKPVERGPPFRPPLTLPQSHPSSKQTCAEIGS
ncbi:hypothetical protein VTJ04DRAFT_9530 [Mycothermus thermophilus]|uniref:uncharacterized protein n=1 Tax=Humicola insolens TaxID=85995 RepID=UPI0037446102